MKVSAMLRRGCGLFEALLICSVYLFCCEVAAVAQQKSLEQQFDAKKGAVVKLIVEGNDPEGNWKTIEGSGFFIYSQRRQTYILTASHVIGSSEIDQSKNHDWNVLNGKIDRKIKVLALDDKGSLREITDEAKVFPAIMPVDLAILAIIDQDGYKTLPLAESMAEMVESRKIILFGFEKGHRTIEPPLEVAFGRQRSPDEFVTNKPSVAGQSGGPWIDVDTGRVLAVVRGVDGDSTDSLFVSTPTPFANIWKQIISSSPSVLKPPEPRPTPIEAATPEARQITGIVIDESDAPIQGAKVVLIGSLDSALTQEGGGFSLPVHGSNELVRLSITKDGFRPLSEYYPVRREVRVILHRQ
jgi:hypothetical protein